MLQRAHFSNDALSFFVNDPYFDQFPNGFAADPMQIISIEAANAPSPEPETTKGAVCDWQTAPFG
jgi:hypothetical protein